jgi:hypothetical protein
VYHEGRCALCVLTGRLSPIRSTPRRERPWLSSASTKAYGPSAEWIIEALSQDTPAFTPVTFYNCIAGSQHTTLSLTGAATLDMPGPDGNEVTTTIPSASSVTIQWDAFL